MQGQVQGVHGSIAEWFGTERIHFARRCRAERPKKQEKLLVHEGVVAVRTWCCLAPRGLTHLLLPLLSIPSASLEVPTNALEALVSCRGHGGPGVHWHPGDELARLERASG